jgi:hypothetical protein
MQSRTLLDLRCCGMLLEFRLVSILQFRTAAAPTYIGATRTPFCVRVLTAEQTSAAEKQE